MDVHFYGTRGSLPVSGKQYLKYGGNTTALRILSKYLPENEVILLDAGTGARPMVNDLLKENKKLEIVHWFLTHYHPDHTQGFALSKLPYIKGLTIRLYGPYDNGYGPKKMLEDEMHRPRFPVEAKELSTHFAQMEYINLKEPRSTVFIIHKKGGVKEFTEDKLHNLESQNKDIPFDNDHEYSISECLLIKMFKINHPENTICYRFFENPTGRSFTFVTDHENQDGVSLDFQDFLHKSDFLAMDCQYSREDYDKGKVGWGHSTPDYCSMVAETVKAKILGLTHHDPDSSDEKIEELAESVRNHLKKTGVKVFAIGDLFKLHLNENNEASWIDSDTEKEQRITF